VHQFHEFGFCLAPVFFGMVAIPVAGFVDLVGTRPYLILREGTGCNGFDAFRLPGWGRFLVDSNFGIRHINSYGWNGKSEVKIPLSIPKMQDRTGGALYLRFHER
jgi:hypothetical protein